MEVKKQIDWDVRLEKREYGPGEKVSVIGTFRSIANESHVWTVHTQFSQIEAEDFPAGIVPYSVELEPGQEREIIIRDLQVVDEFPPGEYSVKVGLEIERGVMDLKEVNFRIEGTPKPLDFRIILSRDRDSKDLAKVFTSKDKEIYIRVTSDVKTITLSGVCTNPGEKETILEFEEMVSSYPLAGEGVYNLRVTAEAKGYKSITKQVAFSVIRDNPVFGAIDSTERKITTRN